MLKKYQKKKAGSYDEKWLAFSLIFSRKVWED